MFDLNRTENSILHEHISKLMRENSDLEKQLRSKKYWKNKAEKAIKENIYLKDHIKNLELELSILKAPRNIRNSDEWRKSHPFG